jgi:hypothetical protein
MNQVFIVAFTNTRNWNLSWENWIHSTPSYTIILGSILISCLCNVSQVTSFLHFPRISHWPLLFLYKFPITWCRPALALPLQIAITESEATAGRVELFVPECLNYRLNQLQYYSKKLSIFRLCLVHIMKFTCLGVGQREASLFTL